MDSNQSSFTNIIVNIFVPVMILNKGHKVGLSPAQALIIALAFPLCFGLYSLIKERKMNYIALLGLANILFSGILTLLALGGIWFAIKEALFPLLIGAFVLASSYSKKPFFKMMFLNPAAFNVAKIQEKLDTPDKEISFERLMQSSTKLLSISFLISAALNFILSLYIFTPIEENLPILDKQALLNQQLSQMTMYSMPVILVPMMLFVGGILYFSFKKTTQITNLNMDELFIK
jgi:hypothetical protein